MWLAGGGAKPGFSYGRTDDYCYNVTDEHGNPLNPTKDQFVPGAVHVHDLQATILHLMGIDHERLTYKFQGRRLPADRRPRARGARFGGVRRNGHAPGIGK